MHAWIGHSGNCRKMLCVHTLCNSMLTGFLFCFFILFGSFHEFQAFNDQKNKLSTNNSTTKAKKKWTQFSSVTVAHDWSGFLFTEQTLSTSYLHILALPLRWNGQMEDIQYFYNDRIPFGQEELQAHTHTHTDHTYLPKGSPCRWAGSFFITLAQRNQVCSNGAQSHWARAMEG